MNHTTWCDTCALVHTEKKGTFMCFCECHNVEIAKHASGKITANGIEVVAPTKSAEKPTGITRMGANGQPYTVPISTTDTSDWRERFDDAFAGKDFMPPFVKHAVYTSEVKAFIEKELERAREEGRRNPYNVHDYTYIQVVEERAFEAGRAEERARVREKLEAFRQKGQTKNTFSDPRDAFHAGRRRGRNDVVRELLDAFKD